MAEDGKVDFKAATSISRDEARFSCDVSGLAMGLSKVAFRLLTKDGAELGHAELTFRRLPEMAQRRDAHAQITIASRLAV